MTGRDCARPNAQSPYSHPLLAKIYFSLDVRLRRWQETLEYTQNPSCIFRLQIDRSRRPLTLRDGTHQPAGQPIARLHFWNEHIPPVPKNGATIAWARRMQQGIAISLRELASYLASRPDLRDIAVICGDVPSGASEQRDKVARIMAYYGFETIAEPAHSRIGPRLRQYADNLLISLIVYAQNAPALRFDSLRRVRVPIYISRRALEERFGAAAIRRPK